MHLWSFYTLSGSIFSSLFLSPLSLWQIFWGSFHFHFSPLLGHTPLDSPLCSVFHILGWALFFETFFVLYVVCPILELIHTILFDPPFPPLPLILWVSRSFLTENLWSYHHFLAVFTVIFWLFGFKVLSLVIGLTVLRAFHPPLGCLFLLVLLDGFWVFCCFLGFYLLSHTFTVMSFLLYIHSLSILHPLWLLIYFVDIGLF